MGIPAAAGDGHRRAQLALDIYAYRIKMTFDDLDALIFTGGIGENSAWLRSEVCEGLRFLDIHLDDARNTACRPDIDIATSDSPARVLVIHAREDLLIARESRRLAVEAG